MREEGYWHERPNEKNIEGCFRGKVEAEAIVSSARAGRRGVGRDVDLHSPAALPLSVQRLGDGVPLNGLAHEDKEVQEACGTYSDLLAFLRNKLPINIQRNYSELLLIKFHYYKYQ